MWLFCRFSGMRGIMRGYIANVGGVGRRLFIMGFVCLLGLSMVGASPERLHRRAVVWEPLPGACIGESGYPIIGCEFEVMA